MDIFTSLVIPALVGIGIGILSGMLGIGGGTVLVPIFRLAFGMSPIMSTATSLFTIIPTSVSGAVSHIRHKTCVPSLGLAAGLGGACTSPIGVWLATISPAWMVMLAAALIIGYSAVNMLRKAWKMKPARAGAAAPAAPAGEPPVEAAVEQAGDA
ncbi:sulfite exporter TauE/SafE family protein, partial [Gordonibacter urolithinfaciens]|uniref:sulfite exporter TauE/SafE family protein n=1 Tax=Gordonibacter urolithinfaciens TaxID=1335613 RepID=UPI003A8CD662